MNKQRIDIIYAIGNNKIADNIYQEKYKNKNVVLLGEFITKEKIITTIIQQLLRYLKLLHNFYKNTIIHIIYIIQN
jgi:hypothetical protein